MTFSKAPEYGYRYMVPVVALQFVTCDRKVCMHEEESGDSHGWLMRWPKVIKLSFWYLVLKKLKELMRVIVHQAQTSDDFEIYDNNPGIRYKNVTYQATSWNTPLPLGLRNILSLYVSWESSSATINCLKNIRLCNFSTVSKHTKRNFSILKMTGPLKNVWRIKKRNRFGCLCTQVP